MGWLVPYLHMTNRPIGRPGFNPKPRSVFILLDPRCTICIGRKGFPNGIGKPEFSLWKNKKYNLSAMNFLITGAAGFLGSSLANHLAREGHQVRGLDDLSTGDPQALAPDVHFTRGDVSDRPKLWTLLQEVDVVYHLAARVSVPESVLYPRDYNTVNVGGTVALMEAMRDVGVRRVVLASSGAVYGDLGDMPLQETDTPNPRSPYAVSKLAAEFYVRTIGGLWGIETVSLRIFNAYGPGQHLPASHPPVLPYFLRQASRERDAGGPWRWQSNA